MNALHSILKGTFNYEHGFFVDDEQITICQERNICYYDMIDFYVNTSKHEIIDRKECCVCNERSFEPMYGYTGTFIHYSCYDIIKNILNKNPLFDVKLVFSGDFRINIHVYGILSNNFIISNDHSINSWSIGYGRPCQDFHFMLGNFKPYKKTIGGECEMCFEEGKCYNDYCKECIKFINIIQKNMLIKYMLFDNIIIKDINIIIIHNLIDIYESII